MVAIAQRAPTTTEDLRRVRGVEKRHLDNDVSAGILRAVSQANQLPPIVEPVSKRTEDRRDLRAAVTLVAAWVAQLARDAALDPALLGTRADIEALVRGDDGAKMGTGWRRELVGSAVGDLLAGRASLAFDGNRGLLLEGRLYSRDAIGARVTVKSSQGSQIATVNPSASYLSSNDKRLQFGLGSQTFVNEISIQWPGGAVDRIENIESNRYYLVQPGGKISAIQQ